MKTANTNAMITVRPAIRNAEELSASLAMRLVKAHTPIKTIPVTFGKYDDSVPNIGTRRAVRVDQSSGFIC